MDVGLLLGSILFAVGVVTLGPWVEMTIFKQVPEDSRYILALLALNLVAFAATLAQSYGLTAMDRAGKTFYANMVGLAMQVVVTVWLVRRMHVPGAAAALLVGSVGVAVVRAYFYAREMREG
jgi:O-antigen/teichoic acid export membrane protein